MSDLHCPKCGDGCWREEVDLGVGTDYGPWGCSCGWSDDQYYDCSSAPADAPEGWRATPHGMLINLEREAEEMVELEAIVLNRFKLKDSAHE